MTNDLRQAAEMALDYFEDAHGLEDTEVAIKEALREALAEPANSTTNLVESKASSQTEQEHLGGEWVPCVKLPVIVHVRNQRNGETHISTREGITPVLPDDLIMRGVAGEEYPIGRELFERTYTFDVDNVYIYEERVHKTEKSIHEPVGYVTNSGTAAYLHRGVYLEDDTPLYTAPPKREWVGLPDEKEILEMSKDAWGRALLNYGRDDHCSFYVAFARAIETYLKEKNQ